MKNRICEKRDCNKEKTMTASRIVIMWLVNENWNLGYKSPNQQSGLLSKIPFLT